MAPCWSGIGQLQCGLLHRVARNTAGVGDIIQEAMLIAYLTIDDLRIPTVSDHGSAEYP